MSFSLATWNINSVRLREPLVLKMLAAQPRRPVLAGMQKPG
jgi:exonuclease III